jgi:transcriptional regulator with XRE-family HTH domain
VIGLHIKEYLKSKGISQTYVAKKIGIATNIFNAMLNGNRSISAAEYFAICEALEVPLETFKPKKTA